jgi:hypothetical protein
MASRTTKPSRFQHASNDQHVALVVSLASTMRHMVLMVEMLGLSINGVLARHASAAMHSSTVGAVLLVAASWPSARTMRNWLSQATSTDVGSAQYAATRSWNCFVSMMGWTV